MNSAAYSNLPGPENIVRRQLPNGIVILVRSNFNSPSVFLSGYLQVGSLYDPDEKLGLADFTAAALMRGNQRRDFQQIYDALESVGASLGFGGGTHTSGFSGKALVEDLDLVLELLSDSLRNPTFPVEHVERLRAQLLTGLAIRAQDTGDMASLTFDQIIYANHPYSRPEDGYPETVGAIQQADLVGFHKQHYGPRGLTVVLVGAVEPERAIEKVERVLGDWQYPEQPQPVSLPALAPLGGTQTRRVMIPGKSQADLVMGMVGPKRSAPDYVAASLGNSVLGQFGLYGRVGEVVRERAGLAYYAYTSLNAGIGPGAWYALAGVDPENIDRVVDLIQKEFRKFTSKVVTKAELEDSQANYIGRLPLSMESNAGVVGALLNLERYELGLDYYQHYPEMIRKVTPKAVLEAARHYLDLERLGIAIAGTVEE